MGGIRRSVWGLGAASLLVACSGPVLSPSIAGTAAGSGSESGESTSAVDGERQSSTAVPDDEGSTSTESGEAPDDPGGSSSTGEDPSQGPAVGSDPGPPFTEVSEAAGVQVPHLKAVGQWGMGIAWRDFDADGDEDVFVTGGSLPSALLRNEGDGHFSPVESAAVAALVDTAGASWADVDDDGWPELLVLGKARGWLLHNEAGTLVDATEGSGTGLESRSFGQSAAWADVNGDGHLDVFVAHSGYQGSRLYLGDGAGGFSDASGSFDITIAYYPLAVGFFDMEDDGDPDLYVVHDRRDGNHLWRNDGPGCGGWCFTEVGAQLGADVQVEGMGLAVGDPDEDEDLDLFFTDSLRATLLRNDGPAGFVDLTVEAGLDAPTFGWGALFFDYDADGHLDLYEGVQSPGVGINRLYRGRGDGSFESRTADSGAQSPGESMSVAHADYDGDGAPDLLVGNENEGYRLYRNRRADAGRRWLVIELRGAGPVPRDAVGSRVIVQTASGRRMMRQVEIGSGFGSSNTPRLHFGVDSDPAVAVEVHWTDGTLSEPWPPVEGEPWIIDYSSP